MADLMIGILSVTTPDLGVLKSGSLTIKPTYKEHKSGFPQLTDVKVPEVITASFKLDCEEIGLAGPALKTGIVHLVTGSPVMQEVIAVAPTAQGSGFNITGDGFIKGGSVTATEGDFGTASIEIDCVPMEGKSGSVVTFTGGLGSGTTIATPSYTNQVLTKDSANLGFGTPKCGGDGDAVNCKTVTFTASSNFKYHTVGYPPVIDLAIMESCDLSISAEFQDPSAGLLADALAALAPGAVPVTRLVTMHIPTLADAGGDASFSITLGHAMVEPDLTFNPGNDWNGITVKCTSMLKAGDKQLLIS